MTTGDIFVVLLDFIYHSDCYLTVSSAIITDVFSARKVSRAIQLYLAMAKKNLVRNGYKYACENAMQIIFDIYSYRYRV